MEAPFYIGQKVVALDSGGMIKKDKVYTVAECFLCMCGIWSIAVYEHDTPFKNYTCDCGRDIITQTSFVGGNVKHFAPIEENTYENITKELAKLPEDEVPDVKRIYELTN
jgi:hypothetical protein